MRGKRNLILVIVIFSIFSNLAFGESIRERFKGSEKLAYDVSFNGIPSGMVEWQYLGQEFIEDRKADVLFVDSDTKILKLLNLESKEKVYIDSQTLLPLKVERDLVVFGRKEIIEEIYSQEKGQVKIIRKNGRRDEEILYQKAPIHNILALLYFFPENIEFEKDKLLTFNLPTQRLKIRMVDEREIRASSGKKESYFLRGRGEKKFNLWLDKETMLPLRLEFILPLGSIVVTKKSN